MQYMQDHQQDFLRALEGAVRRESPTEGDPGDLAACRDYFADLFRGIGFHVTVVKSLDGRFGDHLLLEYGPDAGRAAEELVRWRETRVPGTVPQWTRETGGASRRLLFGGHYDTVHAKGIFGPDVWKVDGDRAARAQRVLELNPDSAPFAALQKAVEAGDKDTVSKYAKLLYGQALLLADLPLEDPAEYAQLVCSLMV